MADPRSVTAQELYRKWQGGDVAAGQAMAQRFSDWYYAVTASRLGDAHGRMPLQRSCTRFQQGIVSVTNEGDLVRWAHGILDEELKAAGGRISGGDFPNQLTAGRSPTDLLNAARAGLPPEYVRLLAHAYDSAFPLEEVGRGAEALGGMPLAVLKARYALKRWLRDNAQVAFSEVPDEPNLDYAPLPLYEAGRMQSAAEETNFEKWLLSNMGLCKDIAEFGVFALALRAGAFRAAPAPQPTAATPPAATPASRPAPPPPPASAPAPRSSGFSPLALGVVLAGGILLVLTALAGAYFLG